MRKLAASVGIVVASLFGFAAGAQAYPPGPPGVDISDADLAELAAGLAPGESFTITVSCVVGDPVSFTISDSDGDTISSETVTCEGPGGGAARGIMQPAGGSATATLTAPTVPGTYTLTVSSPSGSTSVTFTVLGAAPAPAAPTPAGELPTTGSDSSVPVAQIAIGIVLAGAGLVAVAAYRRRSAASA